MGLKGESLPSSSVIIRPSSGWVPLNLAELWDYRELLYFLTLRSIKGGFLFDGPNRGSSCAPLFTLLALMTAPGVGIWLSALNAQYRDVRYTLPFLTQFCLFATPVVYPASLVPDRWSLLYGLNPMTGVVEGFRWVLLGKTGAPALSANINETLTPLEFSVEGE